MKIFFDHQIFSLQDYGGISKYFSSLIMGLKQNGISTNRTCWFSDNEYLIKNKRFKNISLKLKPTYKRYPYFLLNSAIDLLNLKLGKYDIYHATYDESYFLGIVNNMPLVVTAHDCIYEKFGEKMKWQKHIIDCRKKIYSKAHKIIAVSNATKVDLLKYYDIDSNKIKVIYHGTYFNRFNKKPKNKLIAPQQYYLYVGLRSGYKNFTFLLKSISNYLRSTNHSLYCLGGGLFTSEEMRLINKLNLSLLVKLIPYTSEAIAYKYYKNAIALILPSKYEGFGIPIIESFSTGTPVIASDIPSSREIGGDATSYFKLNSQIDLINTIEKINHDKSYVKKVIKLGRKIGKKFTWKNATSKTLNVYRDVIQK